MSDHITGYAEALLAVARADGNLETVKSQLADVAAAIESNEELRSTLSNNTLPADVRGQVIDDLLANKTTDTTRALSGLIVSSGHGSEFSQIVDAFVAHSAAASGKTVATVRTAVAMTEDQQTRLAKALKASTGNDVELQIVIDPSVVGGAVTTMGDTIIDGSLRNRLSKMRETI